MHFPSTVFKKVLATITSLLLFIQIWQHAVVWRFCRMVKQGDSRQLRKSFKFFIVTPHWVKTVADVLWREVLTTAQLTCDNKEFKGFTELTAVPFVWPFCLLVLKRTPQPEHPEHGSHLLLIPHGSTVLSDALVFPCVFVECPEKCLELWWTCWNLWSNFLKWPWVSNIKFFF